MPKTLGSPDVYVVVETRGDGYGHCSEELIAWFHSEADAAAYEKLKTAQRPNIYVWYRTEEVPHGPIEW